MTIYFIRAGDSGNIKIGYTAGSAERRMKQLQTGNIFDLELLGTIPGEMQDEKSMHQELKEYALRGEWFRSATELMAVILEMIDGKEPWYYCRKIRLHKLKDVLVEKEKAIERRQHSLENLRSLAKKFDEPPPWLKKRFAEESRKLRSLKESIAA